MARKLDGEGRPYITLAQVVKLMGAADNGAAAKALVREGLARVNGERDERPGRKLHPGDVVEAEGERFEVKAEHVGQ